jgi:hypothetical protein
MRPGRRPHRRVECRVDPDLVGARRPRGRGIGGLLIAFKALVH